MIAHYDAPGRLGKALGAPNIEANVKVGKHSTAEIRPPARKIILKQGIQLFLTDQFLHSAHQSTGHIPAPGTQTLAEHLRNIDFNRLI